MIVTSVCIYCGAVKEVDTLKSSYVCPLCMKRNPIVVEEDENSYIDTSLIPEYGPSRYEIEEEN